MAFFLLLPLSAMSNFLLGISKSIRHQNLSSAQSAILVYFEGGVSPKKSAKNSLFLILMARLNARMSQWNICCTEHLPNIHCFHETLMVMVDVLETLKPSK